MTQHNVLYPWIKATAPAPYHLVMCPFAGGSGSAFKAWRDVDTHTMDVSLAIYPGRDHRMRERCAETITALAAELYASLLEAEPVKTALNAGTLVLAGHSMGAQVAFETCSLLEQAGLAPALLVLSGCHAPHLRGNRLLSHLDDDGFVQQLVAIGGGSDALLSDTSLRAVFMPMLRADFQATEAYSRPLPADGHTLTTPTLLVFGSDDAEASREEVDAWQVWLQQPCKPVMISGDHFYATRRPRAFLGQIMHRLDAISHGMHKRIG